MHLSESTRPKLNVISLLTLRFIVVLFSFFVFVSGCVSIPDSENLVTKRKLIYKPKHLREDLQFLDMSLREIHPEPFARFKVSDYEKLYQQLYLDLSSPLSRNDFYRKITPLISKFSDIHTRLLFPQKEYQYILERYGKFPLAVLYSSDGLIVVADHQQIPKVPVGAELLAINNVNVVDILNKFRNYVPAETDTGQRRMIQMEFPRLLWSIYEFTSDYQVEYLWQGQVFKKQIKAVRQQSANARQSQVASHYGAMQINGQTTLLWLNDFNEQYDVFDTFLQRQFQTIKDQDKGILILDLRYNQGGITDNLALLLTYLTNEPISWASHGTLKLSSNFREQHSLLLGNAKNEKYGNYLDWLPVEYLNRLQWDILFTSDGDWLDADIEPVVSEKENAFAGKIYILSNGYCLSACASLIATLQDNNKATIIGESPGSLTEIQYGYPVETDLPNTKLKLVIPAMKFIHNESKVKANTRRPDYQVERLRADVLLGQDPVFNLAMELSKAR